MLYAFIKIIARIGIRFYCRDMQINKKELLKLEGPLLLAVNHPNSFIDAIIFCTLLNKPVYSLARGDAFKNKFFAKILYGVNMFPVYRVSEGVENMDENYKTFELCKDIFKKKGIVLIFSEGRCVNEWHLRPLKKGTARLALSSWEEGIPLKVLPVDVNYSSFKKFGKNIKLFFGEFITATDIQSDNGHGRSIQSFNSKLLQQLQPFVFEIDPADKRLLHEKFYVEVSLLKKTVLFIPAMMGYILHAPLYLFTKWLNKTLVREDGHFDSVMICLLFFLYPLYLFVLVACTWWLTTCWYSCLLLLLLPFTAWAYVQLKKQLD